MNIKSLLNISTPGWSFGEPLPAPPSNFPKVLKEVKKNPEKYLRWLGGIAKEHADKKVRNYAAIKYKVEYFARQKDANQLEASSQVQIDNAGDALVKLDAIQFSCKAGMFMIGVVSTVQMVAVLGSFLSQAAIQMLQNSGPRLALAAASSGGVNIITAGGGTIALTQVQAQVLLEKGIVSASALGMAEGMKKLPTHARDLSKKLGMNFEEMTPYLSKLEEAGVKIKDILGIVKNKKTGEFVWLDRKTFLSLKKEELLGNFYGRTPRPPMDSYQLLKAAQNGNSYGNFVGGAKEYGFMHEFPNSRKHIFVIIDNIGRITGYR